ncbi:MAG: 16S rRNA (adenine(1518)-N(6)/adenine(1519)-N(6))-dimethyltransferase RsmA [Candidatus Caenarcaniphilales bacterium]|nr:16S rRNA (adenine(1518)-N(6)/adenine(1519)-N(6))-dimethyltransferase RsmA [Candidatus Caenarcaniphilales bacterium]
MSLLKRAKSFQTKKALGQNFLVDESFLERIEKAIDWSNTLEILEIGSGIGFLTERLVKHHLPVYALDFDAEALMRIPGAKNLIKINADALRFDFESLPTPLTVVGNLPFNIGTLILIRLLGEITQSDWAVPGIKEMVLMFQKELAERLCAEPGSRAYNPLSILVQAKAEVTYLFDVPAQSFHPVPKVAAGVVRLIPRQENPLRDLTLQELESLSGILKTAFNQKRKMIRNSLMEFFSNQDLKACNILPELRAERLSLGDYINLTKYYHQRQNDGF